MSNCMECGVTVYFEESPSYDVCAETGDKYCVVIHTIVVVVYLMSV